MKTNCLDENSDTRGSRQGKRECPSNARGTVVRNETDEVATLGHTGPFIHSGLCPQTKTMWDEIITSVHLKITLAAIKI